MNLLQAIHTHQNKAELSQPSDALGKEKSNSTHNKINHNPQGNIKNQSNDKLDCKQGVGTCNWQLQDEECEQEPHAAKHHQEEGQLPKADVKGDWETWMSENLQSKRCNRL